MSAAHDQAEPTRADAAMILAGLRLLQERIALGGHVSQRIMDILTEGGVRRFSAADIDELCVKINFN